MTERVTGWCGIRFATIDHRFAAPRPHALEHPGTPGAGSFGAAPPQPVTDGINLGAPPSEDCLFLNVWAPTGRSGLPVLVWLFGGGFEHGAASQPEYDGHALADNTESVVVTVNYRVGAFGFASLAHHGGRLADATNLGVRDVLAALAWVERNIERFGGDPGAITLAGQSAGGFLATAVAVAEGAPSLRGLAAFSGSASRVASQAGARHRGDDLLERLGVLDRPDAAIDLPVDDVLEAQQATIATDIGLRNAPEPVAFGVVLDTDAPHPVVPEHPLELITRGRLASTSVLLSATVDEADALRARSSTPASKDEVAGDIARITDPGPARDRLTTAYAHADLWYARQRLLSDYIWRMPAARTHAAQQSARGSSVLLDIGREAGRPAGHGADLPAIFGRGHTPGDRMIAMILRALVHDEQSTAPGAVRIGDDWGEAIEADRLAAVWEGVRRP